MCIKTEILVLIVVKTALYLLVLRSHSLMASPAAAVRKRS